MQVVACRGAGKRKSFPAVGGPGEQSRCAYVTRKEQRARGQCGNESRFYQFADPKNTQALIDEVRAVVATAWRYRARALHLPGVEVQMMDCVFGI
jgi:hypothetical protein